MIKWKSYSSGQRINLITSLSILLIVIGFICWTYINSTTSPESLRIVEGVVLEIEEGSALSGGVYSRSTEIKYIITVANSPIKPVYTETLEKEHPFIHGISIQKNRYRFYVGKFNTIYKAEDLSKKKLLLDYGKALDRLQDTFDFFMAFGVIMSVLILFQIMFYNYRIEILEEMNQAKREDKNQE